MNQRMLFLARFHKFALYLLREHNTRLSERAFAYCYFRLSKDEMKKLDKLCKGI